MNVNNIGILPLPHKPIMVSKGWGYELIFQNKEYCGKLLHFVRGMKCSLHFHVIKDETFYVHSGAIQVEVMDEEGDKLTHIMHAGDCLHLRAGMRHRVNAIQTSDVFEFSTHDMPEDSIRIEKGD